MAAVPIKDLNYYYDNAFKALNPQMTKALKDNDSLRQEQEKVANDTYNKAVSDTKVAYEDSYRENAIQKLINENEIAEDMASMGLSNSGLNRTQQTAVQLSYANNKSGIDRQKQAQLDTFAQNLAAEISSIKQTYLTNKSNIENQFSQLAMSEANTARNADIAAEAERQKNYYSYLEKQAEKQAEAEQKGIINSKNGILSRNYIGSLSENGVSVSYDLENDTTTYTDRKTGYQSTFARNTNPYTNTVNPDTEYGTFDNGYQPNNIGNKKLEDTGEKGNINGIEQKLFKIAGSNRRGTENYWIWDGSQNKYVRAYDEDGEWVVYR